MEKLQYEMKALGPKSSLRLQNLIEQPQKLYLRIMWRDLQEKSAASARLSAHANGLVVNLMELPDKALKPLVTGQRY
jgi:hypothetical protein